jgi:hypothetical protein
MWLVLVFRLLLVEQGVVFSFLAFPWWSMGLCSSFSSAFGGGALVEHAVVRNFSYFLLHCWIYCNFEDEINGDDEMMKATTE